MLTGKKVVPKILSELAKDAGDAEDATALAESAMEIVQVAVETMQATRHRHQHEPDVTIRAIDAATDAIVAALDALQFLAMQKMQECKPPLQKTYWEE